MQKKMVMIMTLGSYQRSRRQSILHSSPAIGHLRIPCLVQRRRSRATSPTEYNRNSGEYQLDVQSAASTFHLVLLTCDSLKGTMFRLLVWPQPAASSKVINKRYHSSYLSNALSYPAIQCGPGHKRHRRQRLLFQKSQQQSKHWPTTTITTTTACLVMIPKP